MIGWVVHLVLSRRVLGREVQSEVEETAWCLSYKRSAIKRDSCVEEAKIHEQRPLLYGR